MTPARPLAISLNGYMFTTGAAVAVSLAVRLLLSSVGPFGPPSCGTLSKATSVLLVVIGGEFLVSIGLIVPVIWRLALVAWERRVLPLAYAVAIVATYGALVLGVRTAFAC